MIRVLDIRLQKIFLIVLVLKVLSSGLGWSLGFPWSLGFFVPLILMSAYIAFGLQRRNDDVTDEKFADTCYYLGFIFTITSIIFSLLDLPSIGTKIQDISVRFGAAMVSTVLGLGVRVYLVSFKQDVADAIADAENAVIEASHKLREQLVIAVEKLRDFQSEVDVASRVTVERVNLQVEALSKNHADKLTNFFADLTTRNQNAFIHSFAEVKTASSGLAGFVDGYALSMTSTIASIEAKVLSFTEAVTDRLKTTTFPDDYFSRNLATPLTQLQSAASDISTSIQRASNEVGASTVVLSIALKQLRDKANIAEGSLDTVLKLTQQQQAVLTTSQVQITTLELVTSTLTGLEAMFGKTMLSINASSAATSELTSRVSDVAVEGSEARKALEKSLTEIIQKLGANAHSTEALSTQIAATVTASKQIAIQLAASAKVSETVAGKLAANSAASALVAVKLDGIASADIETAKTLSTIGKHASTAVGKVSTVVEQLQDMVRQLASLDAALRAQGIELKDVAERIKDVRVTVEMAPQIQTPYDAALPYSATLLIGLDATPATAHENNSKDLEKAINVDSANLTQINGLGVDGMRAENEDITRQKVFTSQPLIPVETGK